MSDFTLVRTGDGTVSAPSYSFVNDPDTGFYLDNLGVINVVLNGVVVARFSGAFEVLNQGNAGSPVIINAADPDTGLFWVNPNILAFSTGGVERFRISSAGLVGRITPRVVSAVSYVTSATPSFATADMFVVTAQAGALLFNNPGGAPAQGAKMMMRIKDNGTARLLTYGTQYRGDLPPSTIPGKTMYMGFIWNATDIKLDLMDVKEI